MWIDLLLHDPLTRFLAQVVAVVVVSRLLGLVARRVGQPLVIAEITAGILLGPSLLGALAPEVAGALFAEESLGFLQLASQIGLVLFMFLIGLELDPKLLRGRGHTSVVISHTSIIVPFGLGALLALDLYPRLSDPGVSRLAFTLFLGCAMSITAFPVLARILSERRLLRSRVGAVTIACAAVDDVTAWCILAFVVAAARSTGFESAAVTTGLALAYILAMFGLVRPLLRRLADRVSGQEGLTQNVVAVVLLLLFASSWATELIGIHALFGAFVLGAVLPKGDGLGHALAEKIEDLVLVVFLPLFFAYSGIRTHIGLLDTPAAWLTCGAIVLVACAGKFGGSFLAARWTGLSWRESGALGVLMNTRGLMELIVLNIGLDLGVISPTLFTMMVVMALVTTFMTTPILELVYPAEELVRDLLVPASPAAPADAPEVGTAAGTAAGIEPLDVLVCVGQDRSGPALATLAGALAGGAGAVQVHALHLVPPSERGSARMGRTDRESRPADVDTTGLDRLLERARDLELDVRPTSFVSSEPARDICRVAEVKEVDLVLMGRHRPVLSQTLLGGEVHDVLKAAPCDVGVLVDRGLERVGRVLVPFVGTPHDRAALAIARRLLGGAGVEVTLLHVRSPEAAPGGGAIGPLRGEEDVFEEPEGGRLTVRVVHDLSPVDVALREIRTGYDLVVVGVGRDWGLEHRLLGLQPERLLRESPASLLVVRGHAASREPERVRRPAFSAAPANVPSPAAAPAAAPAVAPAAGVTPEA